MKILKNTRQIAPRSWAVLALSMLALGGCTATRPELGLVDRSFRPCPSSPNCASTQEARSGLGPLRYDGSRDAAVRRLVAVLESMPGARVVAVAPHYVRAEFTSRLFGFVDDVEAVLDHEKAAIHLRSASRSGYWDLGVNRARLEEIRRRFEGGYS